jgi:hypothetical protein
VDALKLFWLAQVNPVLLEQIPCNRGLFLTEGVRCIRGKMAFLLSPLKPTKPALNEKLVLTYQGRTSRI